MGKSFRALVASVSPASSPICPSCSLCSSLNPSVPSLYPTRSHRSPETVTTDRLRRLSRNPPRYLARHRFIMQVPSPPKRGDSGGCGETRQGLQVPPAPAVPKASGDA